MAPVDPNSRDWAALPDDVPIDQATDLPDPSQVTLKKMGEPVDDAGALGPWVKKAATELLTQGLHRLIDIRVPRPKRGDPNADVWLRLSRQVKIWLESGIAGKLVRKIEASGRRVELADEFLDQARRVFQGGLVNTDMDKVVAFFAIKRSSFPNAIQFVNYFRDEFTLLQDQEIDVSPYIATFVLLDQLDPDHRHLVTSIITDVNTEVATRSNRRNFGNSDFQQVCDSLIYRLNKGEQIAPRIGLVQRAPATPAPTSTTTPKPKQTDRKSSALKRKNAPPPGVSQEAHAKVWREIEPQMNEDGKCAYCDMPYHGPATCYYLNPDRRPLGWKALNDLWAYQLFKPGTKQHATDTSTDRDDRSVVSSSVERRSHRAGRGYGEDGSQEETKSEDIFSKDLGETHRRLPLLGGLVSPMLDFVASRRDWQVVTNSPYHIAADRSCMVEYQAYGPNDTPFEWTWYTGKREKALGKGKAKITLLLGDGIINDLTVDCFYQPNCRFSIFSTSKVRKDKGINYDLENLALYQFGDDGKLKVFGEAFEENGVSFLRTATFHPVKAPETPTK